MEFYVKSIISNVAREFRGILTGEIREREREITSIPANRSSRAPKTNEKSEIRGKRGKDKRKREKETEHADLYSESVPTPSGYVTDERPRPRKPWSRSCIVRSTEKLQKVNRFTGIPMISLVNNLLANLPSFSFFLLFFSLSFCNTIIL